MGFFEKIPCKTFKLLYEDFLFLGTSFCNFIVPFLK
jgi:hypothetical protein